MFFERQDYNDRVVCVDGSIPADEPVFLLRGKDPVAFNRVVEWAIDAYDMGRIDSIKFGSVVHHAVQMREWFKKHA